MATAWFRDPATYPRGVNKQEETVHPKCGICGLGKCTITGSTITMCRRCDSSHHGGGKRWGAPNTPDSVNGHFIGPWRD